MFEIKLDKQPEKFLNACEKILYDRIVEKLKTLADNPVPQDAKRVLGYKEPTFRIIIGKYRALYRINYANNLIVVVKLDHRGAVY